MAWATAIARTTAFGDIPAGGFFSGRTLLACGNAGLRRAARVRLAAGAGQEPEDQELRSRQKRERSSYDASCSHSSPSRVARPDARGTRPSPGGFRPWRQVMERLAPASLAPVPPPRSPSQLLAYVILFGVGEGSMEGLHTTCQTPGAASPAGAAPQRDTVVAFSHRPDAERYAGELGRKTLHRPTVAAWTWAELVAFCSESGHDCRLEARGSGLSPPEAFVSVTDWERGVEELEREGGQGDPAWDLWARSSAEAHAASSPDGALEGSFDWLQQARQALQRAYALS